MLNNILIFFILSYCFGCANSHDSNGAINNLSKQDTLYKNYSKNINSIAINSFDSTTSEGLFLDKNFIYYYERSALFKDSAINFMSDTSHSLIAKKVCVYSMQKASLNDYLIFFRQSLILFEKNKIEEELLRKIIVSGFGKRKLIIENYKDSDVIFILNKIVLNEKITPRLKHIVLKILEGDYGIM